MINKNTGFQKRSFHNSENVFLIKKVKQEDPKIKAKFALYLTVMLEDLKTQGTCDREILESFKGVLVSYIIADTNTLRDFNRFFQKTDSKPKSISESASELSEAETTKKVYVNTHEVTASDNSKQEQFQFNFKT